MKQFIQNRKGQRIAVLVEEAKPQNGLAFVMHGLSGFKEQPHLQTIATAFLENGYTTVRFDTTNTFGESDGRYENATVTNYYEDLEDVIAWSKQQPFYQEPFVLVGHSLGGICVGLYAEKYPQEIKALALISTVVSGALTLENPYKQEMNKEWRRTGWKEEQSISKPGAVKRLPWSHMEDRLKYDLLAPIRHPERSEGSRDSKNERDSSASDPRMTDRLTMPVLLIVGELDQSTPFEQQQILYKALPGQKELHIIPGAPHTFREPEHLDGFKKILNEWITRLS